MDTTTLRRIRLLASAATGLAMFASPWALAVAQEPAPAPAPEEIEAEAEAEGEEASERIVVTGIRAAIESSLAAKRENTSIVEAVSAEDIGKLPDISIAESLSRLPGLAAQRLRGRAQVISVRGLGPDFTTALLNGREQVTAGDNRGVEFDQYPAELISQALVYKTPDAQLVSQGLAGTVDLRTIRPLAFGDRSLTLTAAYEYNNIDQLNDDVENTGYRLSGTYVDQFNNDTLGVVLSVSQQSTPTQSERYEICNFEMRNGARSPECFKMFAESRTLDRTAVLGTIEFEPTATFSSSIDVLYTGFEDSGIRRGIELPTGTWLGCCTTLALQNPQVTNGLITGGVFDNAFGVARNDVQSREADLFSIGWNAEWSPFENWTFGADLSHSNVDRSALDFESYFGLADNRGGAVDDLRFFFAGDRYRFTSTVDYANPATMVLTDPGGWGQDGFHKLLNTDDSLTALRLEAEREINNGPFSSVEGGIYASNREKTRDTVENFVDLASGAAAQAIPSQYLNEPTSLDFVSNIRVLSYDPEQLLADGIYRLRPLPLGFIPQKQWTVEENVIVSYLQGNIDSNLGSKPLRGNVGVQVVHTDQSSTGPVGFGTGFLPVVATDGDTYTEVLPSANFSLEMTDTFYIRLGAARTLARARMDDMRASVGIGTNSQICPQAPNGSLLSYTPGSNPSQTCLSGGSGNPLLRPYMADSFDISFEKYFADRAGYWSVAAFHKEIDTWVFGNVGRDVNAPEIIDAIFGPGTAAANPGIERARFFSAENTDGGWLRGLEFALSLPAEVILPERFEGLGVFASYSITDSEVQPSTSGAPIPIPGLSEDIANVTVYYERDGFQARVSNRWRSDFLAELPDFTGQPDFRSAFSESVIDAQIGYEFTRGNLEGLTLLLQANNLNDEKFGTFVNGDERQARNYEEYGTTYTVRLNYRR